MKQCELAGRRFGRLLVVAMRGVNKDRRVLWLVRCECGTEKTITARGMLSGTTVSCGCIAKKNTRERSLKHGGWVGGRPSLTYVSWLAMIGRCTRPSDVSYPDYGGRGIRVCDRWRDDFAAFLEDVGERPSPRHSIDRINNDGNYEPGNCKWSTAREQARNRRSNSAVPGHRECLVESAEAAGLHPSTVAARLKRGWTTEEALSTSPGHYTRWNHHKEPTP